MTGGGGERALDFFVSHARDDEGEAWGAWIGSSLEEAGYQVALESWAVVPGMSRSAWLHTTVSRAAYTIAVASDAYLRSPASVAEWESAWRSASAGGEQRLLVAKVTRQPVTGLLAQSVPIELLDLPEAAARTALLSAVRGDLPRPDRPAGFPGRQAVFPPDRPAVWNVPEPPARFVGRADDLGRLDAALADIRLVSVTGLAGIGKTSLVSEYVRRHRGDLDAVWWVPGERPELIGERVRELAPRVGLPARAEPAAVVAKLEQTRVRWLMVVDAAEPGALPDWLRPGDSGRLLVTSRNPGWGQLGREIPVAAMDRADAVTLLADRLPAIEPAVADRIAARLGDHPLALDQAAYRIGAGRLPPETYLRGLLDRPEVLLAQGEVPGRPGLTAATLWEEPIRRLDADAPAAGELLRIVAHGDDAPVPLGLLAARPEAVGDPALRAALADPLDLADAVGVLERSGLAHRDGDAVAMHALVRAAVRARTEPERSAEITEAMTGMLRASLPDTVTANPESWAAWRRLSPHALAVLDATDAGTDGRPSAWLAERSAAYLLEQGQAERALPLAARAVATHERLDGADHADTLASRDTLARVTLAAGEIGAAARLAEQNLADRERVLGADHPGTLDSRSTLGLVSQRAGELDRAVELLQGTLTDRARVLGLDHPATLDSRHNLGRAFDEVGRIDEAALLLRDTLEDRRRVLGPDHPATLDTRYQLALTYGGAGATGDAIPLLERTVPDRENVLGAEHPRTLDSRHELAIAYQRAGRSDDAVAEFGRTLELRDRALGPEHPTTLKTVDALARVHAQAGRLEDARSLFDRAVAARERVLGPDHDDTLKSRESLAVVHIGLGRPEDAIPHLERVLDRHQANLDLGPAHRRTMDTRDILATAYRLNGQVEAARPQLEHLLADRARAHGVTDGRTLRTADELTGVYRATGRLSQAVDLNERVLALRETVLGPSHPDTRATRMGLADTYRQAGRPDDAVPLYRRALEDSLREHGPFHPDSARTRLALTDTQRQARSEGRTPLESSRPELGRVRELRHSSELPRAQELPSTADRLRALDGPRSPEPGRSLDPPPDRSAPTETRRRDS